MTTDLSGENVVVHLSSSPQIITAAGGEVARGAGAGAGGGVELGRRLMLAARAGDTAAVLELMGKGAPFSTDWLGTSPLHLAAANDHADTCAVLLRAGVSRDARTKVERTPLHLAAAAGHARVAALLLEHGAAPDARDMLRMTPLHWAAARGHAAVARALLRRGADPTLRCKFRKTPRCLALRAARPDLVALLDAAQQRPRLSPAPDAPDAEPDEPGLAHEYKNVQRVEAEPQTKVKAEKKIIIESKTQPIPASANVGRGASVGGAPAGGADAAALLRAHGITLLPTDRGSTVLSALRSGRTVVLSDAGKLMLKESSASAPEPRVLSSVASSAANVLQVDAASERGDARGRPRGVQGVKLLTLNKHQPLKRVIHPTDLQQVKVVRMPAGAGAGASAGVGASAGGGRQRPALKIVLDKAHLHRLLATARTTGTAHTPTTPDTASCPQSAALPEGGGGADGALRAQLAAARAQLASMDAELRACRARLAHYEP